jgi:outer membrane protein, heavy metal efflux system
VKSNLRLMGFLPVLLLVSLLVSLSACSHQPVAPSASQRVDERQMLAQVQSHLGWDAATPQPASADEFLTLNQSLERMLQQSPALREQLAQLGVAESARLQATLLDNPHIELAATDAQGRWNIEVGLLQPLWALLARPLRESLADARYEAAVSTFQAELIELMSQTSQAYIDTVAAQQMLHLEAMQRRAAEAERDLAQGYFEAGNLPRRQWLYYQKAALLAQSDFQAASHRVAVAALHLKQALGEDSGASLRLPNRLPLPPPDRFDKALLLAEALDHRPDLAALESKAAALASKRQLASPWRRLAPEEAGLEMEQDESRWQPTWRLGFELPLWDDGRAGLARVSAEESLVQAQIERLRLRIDRDLALALSELEQARERFNSLQQALPLAEEQLSLLLREVNFMLESPFELLREKSALMALQQEAIEACADYWQARAELTFILARALPSSPQFLTTTGSPQQPDPHNKPEPHHD